MQKKKILVFSLGYYPNVIGGAEIAIKEITDRLDPERYELHLVCNRYDSTLPKTEQVGPIMVHRIGLTTHKPAIGDLRKLPLHLNKALFQFGAFWKARTLHKEYKFDAIWAMMAHSCGVPAGSFKNAFPDVPYVLTLQEGDPPEYIENKMKWFGKMFDRAFANADVIQAISTFLERWAQSKGFTGKSVVIPNAVNTAHFTQTYSEAELQAARDELGKKAGDVFLVTTSRLVPKNAVDDVIKAIAMLPEQVHFVVFGTGPDEADLKRLAKIQGVAERIHFRGQIGHDVMPKYLKACDIFIRPSRSEGMGNSFVEAMAAELPVIATQEGGIADFLFDERRNPDKGTTGWAVDKNAPEQIKEAVEDIMARPEKVAEVTARAKQMAIEQYDWDLIAKRMDEEVFSPLFR